MKIIMILLQSLDGYIARYQGDDLSWGSKVDKEFFRAKTKEVGTMIMGSNTFEAMPPKAFSDRLSIVFTSNPDKYSGYTNEYGKVEFYSGTPEDLLQSLESRGIEEAVLIGGGKLNNEFLKRNLVNEMFITISPKIFATGIRAYGDDQLDVNLELVDSQKISSRELLLRFKVINSD